MELFNLSTFQPFKPPSGAKLLQACECGKISAMRSHRATGNPRGRPPSIRWDIDTLILDDLESRMDPSTHLVIPAISQLAAKLKISRSTAKRVIARLRRCGYIELYYTKETPTAKTCSIYYRMLTPSLSNESSGTGS